MHEWKSLSHVRWECKYHVVRSSPSIVEGCYMGTFGVAWGEFFESFVSREE